MAISDDIREVLADHQWRAAMNKEMKAIQQMTYIWELIDCPPGKNMLDNARLILLITKNTPQFKGLR